PTCCSSSLFFFVARLLSGSPLFPYTTLFRSSEFRIVGEASGSREATELVRRRRPRLLLVDYRLPDELGTVLVRRLRENGLDAPVLLVTANAEEGLNERASEAGAQGTTLKSANRDALLAAIRAVAA